MQYSLTWNSDGERSFQYGVDRVVVYSRETQVGVPWNGVTSVQSNTNTGTVTSFYMDGIKYYHNVINNDLNVIVDSFTTPDVAGFDGSKSLAPGLILTGQRRQPFDLVYRTLVGNDLTDQADYVINFIYNATALRGNQTFTSKTDSISPTKTNWTIHAIPTHIVNNRPTAHVAIDTRTAPPSVVSTIENQLYGVNGEPGRILTIAELRNLFPGPVPTPPIIED